MRNQWLVYLFCLVLAVCEAHKRAAFAAEQPSASPKTSEGQAVDEKATTDKATENPAAELADAHLKLALAWQIEYRDAKKEDKAAIMKQRPSYSEYSIKFKELADAHPGTEIAASAHAWIAYNTSDKVDKAASMQALVDHHADSEELAKVMVRLIPYRVPTKTYEVQLKSLAERSSSQSVKAAAIYTLLKTYDRARSLRENVETAPDTLKRYSEAESNYFRNFAVKDSEIEALYKTLAEDYSDVVLKSGQHVNISKFVEDGLFKIQHLSVGRIAPDIVAEDIEEHEFKLSDYRGKVVMIAFWGSWCKPCRAMFPHERYLVEKLADKPFALIGVNSDKDVAEARKTAKEENLTWRSFWNGKAATRGQISNKWQVQSWPTTFILDAEGRIHYVGRGGDKADATIVKLLAVMGHDVDLSEPAEESESAE
ncbi:TlpA family protein disulfide reductase [Adhaeretor mobilis]|uniref:Thiol-disulfide oxidoreductase ResA n=1 Tax=Adhaeretor mobilis TaxID=1930276 RepID=A0A517MWL2_9BACT|nr:TlpA disulfide reductase family protein [Adhaeretor mobilis]QDS99270.1 Thiol-disulfide oxidoreductase ResA [Adhaeretor mobilis]